MRSGKIPANIDEYISYQPLSVQTILKEIRKAVREAAPGATEKISYGMPAFSLNGILIYFAAYKNHIGFYPTASGIIAFKEELSEYYTSKGTVHFPVDKPAPLHLIKEIVRFRVEENKLRGRKAKSI